MGPGNVALMGALLAVVAAAGCGNRAPSSSTAPPTPVAQPETAAQAAAPAKVSARVRGGDGDGMLAADITVEIAGVAHALELTSTFDSCEGREAPVERIATIDDDRLWMVQLFCENGEDMFSRQMITALLLASDAPKLLWQGQGSFFSTNGECAEIDILSFRPGAGGTVEAIRTTEVTSSEDAEECEAAAESVTVAATIEIPPASP